MNKLYIALFDEHKLIADFFHHSLERFHQYDVLFSAASEEKLFRYLGPQVKLLLFHAPESSDRLMGILRRILKKFNGVKILVYSPDADAIQDVMNSYEKRVRVVSVLHHSMDFFDALKDLLPEHSNHKEEAESKRQYNLSGFEKIRQNRKWVIIIKCIEDGMKPKEMEAMTELKWNTINSYIEQMQRNTGCGNVTELVLQAKKRGIV